jgi:Flp pilus assembly protein TadD
MLALMSPYDAYRLAEDLFEQRDHYRAAEVLRHLVDTHPDERDLSAARELLARAYYHSAQVGRAAETAREILAREPDNAYAALLLTRSLERASRREEAASARRLSDALGA